MDNPVAWGRLSRAALPIVALVTFVVVTGATLAVAGATLGFDFLAYHQAAVRLVAGAPLYDLSFQSSGGFGLFYYPPTFAPFILAFGLLSANAAAWVWIAILLIAFALGVALLPVSRTIRWWIVLLAGLSWPLVYAIKLGQVGPLLFLLFAIGWRSLDDPFRSGVSAALGTAIKLQPGILFVWALLTRRWGSLLVGGIVLGGLALGSTLLANWQSWSDFASLVRQVGDPISTPHNFTPGAVAYQLGVPPDIASIIQLASSTLVLAAIVAAARWATAEASFLVAVIASQLLSPILWDHYAMILLLPVAYLLSTGRWWALAIPLASSVVLVGVIPPIVYPISFFVTLVGTLAVGIHARQAAA